jgi:soluble lytic murein transglycosylase-like protein
MKQQTLTLCATALACAAWGLPAHAAVRYECRAYDGATHRFADNPLPRLSALLVECTTVQVADEPQESAGQGNGVMDVVIINRREEPLTQLAGTSYGTLAALPESLAHLVEAAARRHEIDARIVQAVMQVESAYNPQARSPVGAMGLMQLMPTTATRLGLAPNADLLDPATNIDLGVKYLRLLGDMFNGRLDLVLAAYNAGEGAVMRHGMRVPPYPETENYVRKISALLDAR